MSKKIIIIGALSTGEGIGSILAEQFPADYTIESFAPFNLALPEIGAFVRPGESVVVNIKDPDSLARAAISASQVAFLNGTERLITVTLGAAKKADLADEPGAPAEGAELVADPVEDADLVADKAVEVKAPAKAKVAKSGDK